MLNDEALSAPEVAAILHIGRNAVYDLAKSGKLPSYRMGRKLLFGLADVEAYLASKRLGDSESAAPLFPPETTKLEANALTIGGNGIASLMLTDRLRDTGTQVYHCAMTSYAALRGIYETSCHAALAHLYDQRTNSYNIPFVQRLIPGTSVIVFRLAKRQQGFIVAKSNPLNITSWGALLRPGIRLANRLRGCGSRILLDEKLLAMDAKAASIVGYEQEFSTPLQAGQAVSAGTADVTVAAEQIAAQVQGVDFIPTQQEWVDLVVVKNDYTKLLIRQMKSLAKDEAFRQEFGRVVRGDTSTFGAIVYEC